MSFRQCRLGMVAGPHPFTAAAGLEMLREGGNAFDAAVAAAFTEGVVQPSHNGVAGYGGTAVVYVAAERRVVCVDFNTEAPAAATPEMYAPESSSATVFSVPGGEHKRGARSVGVPGIVEGLDLIRRSWSTLDLPTLLRPAIRAAREGWPCNQANSDHLGTHHRAMRRDFPETAHLLMPAGKPHRPGALMQNAELAGLLERLGSTGLREFYEGETARTITNRVQDLGGILTVDDMAAYRAVTAEPLTLEFRGHTLSTPPVTAGGVTSLQILAVLEGYELPAAGMTEFFHLFAETLKVCWRRRLTELGDGENGQGQLAPEAIRALQDEVRRGLEHTEPGETIAPDPSRCTSHICTADVHGNWVSLTQTHGSNFGSWVSVPGTGLILGHGMSRFDPRPGWPNSVAPRKRPLHNMAPILACRDGCPVAAYGTPGGRTIVNNQAYFSLGLFAWELGPDEVLALPRLHCEEAEPLSVERRAGSSVIEQLVDWGHQVQGVEKSGGPAHIVRAGGSPEWLEGATDPRQEGCVAWE